MIYVVTDPAGTILRSGHALTEDDAAAQADVGAGEGVGILTGDHPVMIDDSNINVVAGELAPIGAFPPGDVPELTLTAL